MNRHGLFRCVLALLGFAANLFAQGVGASGDIKGIIKDSSGAVMQNVAVAIVETDKGIRYRVATDSTGQYRLTGLAPANYEVSAAVPGFESQVRKNVALNLGETVIVDFQMKVSAGKEIVEVLAGSPVVDTARGSQAGVLEQQSIRELPIDRRDYLTFALLMPGVSNSNTIADNADFRVKQTPQSGLSFYGSNGRGNNITVDGGEANDDAGGVRLNVSQDAVQEFQINRSNNFAPTAGQQSIAGGLTAQGNGTQVPCLSGPVGAAVAAELGFPAPNPTTSLPAATCAAVLNGALTVSPTTGPLSAFVVNQFEKDGGLFPFPIRQHEASARLDHRFDNSDQVGLRYSFAHLKESDPDVQALIAFSRGTSVLN